MDFDAAVPHAVQRAVALEAGREFCLKDLFEGVAWLDFSRGERRQLGVRFKHEVTTGRVATVVHVEGSHPARYRKET
ncbi:DUF1413 domain-containing protein [Enterorhabdus sp. NM05_H27]|nr:DUF1413 domain-containing protein [Enterorhabdus sp. NM05_H27]